MKSFKLYMEQQNAFTVGLFPGAFKPPHKGHFETAKRMCDENRIAVVLVSSETRENITAEQSLKIWEIYKKYLPKNLHVFQSSGSPITAIYQIVNILNNGKYVPTSEKSLAPLPDALSIAEQLKTNNGPYKIDLYASKEDQKRYAAFFDPKKSELYKTKQVTGIDAKDVSRLASATKAREALKNHDTEEFTSFLPPISDEDKSRIVKLLS